MGRLTKRAADALEPPEKGQAFLWDGELRGFGIRVIASSLKTLHRAIPLGRGAQPAHDAGPLRSAHR